MDNLYLSGLPLEGVINIQWGDGVQQKCQANYKPLKQNWIILLAMQLWSAANEFNIL